ncbi:MAG: sulfotransferase [Woeseiaceae bacterium]|nr:sulfotransferase [Woeseiaceae bacterium]
MANKIPHFPRFLGIGAARAGTTWLSKNLTAHPQIWIPRIKELHYFTRSAKYVGPSQLIDAAPLKRLFSRQKPYRQYRHVATKAVASNIVRPSLKKLMWDANYLLRAPSDDWYKTLFAQGYGRVTGEITPRYSMLDEVDIRALKALIPDLKLIFIMREPVDRAWSLVKYHAKRSRTPLADLSGEELRRRAFADVIGRQSDYEAILSRWRAVFAESQLLEVFYDEISEQPDALLRRIQSFLGVQVTGLADSDSRRKINGSFEEPIPHDLRAELVAHYLPMVARLSEAEGGYFTHWLDSYRGFAPVSLPAFVAHSSGVSTETVSP